MDARMIPPPLNTDRLRELAERVQKLLFESIMARVDFAAARVRHREVLTALREARKEYTAFLLGRDPSAQMPLPLNGAAADNAAAEDDAVNETWQ